MAMSRFLFLVQGFYTSLHDHPIEDFLEIFPLWDSGVASPAPRPTVALGQAL